MRDDDCLLLQMKGLRGVCCVERPAAGDHDIRILHATLALSICMKVRDDCAERPLSMINAAAGHNIACHAGIKYNDICMKVRASDDEQ